MGKKEFSLKVQVMFIQEDCGVWVAQGLGHDIAAQGKSIREARESFEKTVIGQAILDIKDGREPLSDIPPAPDYYFKMFDDSLALKDQDRFDIPGTIPPGFVIDAEDIRIYA